MIRTRGREQNSGAHSWRAASEPELAAVAEEQQLLAKVRRALERVAARPQRGREGGGGEFESLREELFEARDDDVGLVLALMHQQAARDGTAAVDSLPDLRSPYFAHLRVRTKGQPRDILLAPRAFPGLDRDLAIVDWRRAPITEVFFSCQAGDEYEIEARGRILEGVMESRRVLTFDDGELASVSVEGGTVRRSADGWRFEPTALSPPLTGAPDQTLAQQLVGTAAVRSQTPLVAELLDRQQRAVLDQDPSQSLLILGSAGCGKTTVALHRVARLCSRFPQRFGPRRTLVVVPERGLSRLSQHLLSELELDEVQVQTFDSWVAGQARALMSWLPAREVPQTPVAVSQLKRHPAFLGAVDQLIDELSALLAAQLDRSLGKDEAVSQAMAKRHEPVLAHRLRQVERQIVATLPRPQRKRAQQIFHAEQRQLGQIREDFDRLIGDRALLQWAVLRSDGALNDHHVEATLAHTNRQLDDPAELRYAHIDRQRLKPVDGRDIDEATPDELACTIDAEDFAIVLELLYRKAGKVAIGGRKLERVAHLVLDEAQELAPIELRVLGRAVKPHAGTVTVAGDAAQQVDSASWFSSWEAALTELGRPDASSSCLRTTYRCPRPVAEYAHSLLGPLAPASMPQASRHGLPVSQTHSPNEAHAALAIAEVLSELGAQQPRASVAVIARDAPAARELHQVLSRALAARLALDGNFAFAPGIEVTEIAEVKGLEFDYVIVPDASARNYPDTPESRRRLHVAVTRAAHQVWILCPGTPSPILPKHLG